MKGFKIFNSNWDCRGFHYEVGHVYEMPESPKCCERGFHFCEKLSDCFRYYDFDPTNKVAEVEAFGEIDTDGIKSCTNKIRILREINWNELLNIVNKGYGNTGSCNVGSYNAGNRNVGYCNTGHWNTGNRNIGNCNTGDHNAGNRNVGDQNTGNCNVGFWNTGHHNVGNYNAGALNVGDSNVGNFNVGDYNVGEWNRTSFSNGCFNTVEPTITMFNKPSAWTYWDWKNSAARNLLAQIPNHVVKWVWYSDMTDEEKASHPDCERTDGYLKILDESDCGQIWWDNLSDEQKDIIQSMPNFDKTIFEVITGIKIDKESEE